MNTNIDFRNRKTFAFARAIFQNQENELLASVIFGAAIPLNPDEKQMHP